MKTLKPIILNTIENLLKHNSFREFIKPNVMNEIVGKYSNKNLQGSKDKIQEDGRMIIVKEM